MVALPLQPRRVAIEYSILLGRCEGSRYHETPPDKARTNRSSTARTPHDFRQARPPDRFPRPHRPRPPEGRRPAADAAVLLRRPRFADRPALRHTGGPRRCGRLPSPHGADALGAPGPPAAAWGAHGAVPRRHP